VEIVKAGAQASKGFGKTASIYVFDDGGMLLDLAIGGQTFIFKPGALGRSRTTHGALEEGTAHESGRGKTTKREVRILLAAVALGAVAVFGPMIAKAGSRRASRSAPAPDGRTGCWAA
jgi:hypothetical protein